MRSFRYDILVIAIGSVGNDFGTPGVAQHAIMLDTPEQAERFNRRLINACVRAYAQEGPIRPGQLDVAIIGAGATGTELAAGIAPHGARRRRLRARQDRPGEGTSRSPSSRRRRVSCRHCRSASRRASLIRCASSTSTSRRTRASPR
ncbi:MAG: FAD-dependent oxidoreductase [Hyphomicrobium sp.]